MDDETHDPDGGRPDHDTTVNGGSSERDDPQEEPRTEQSLLEDEADPGPGP